MFRAALFLTLIAISASAARAQDAPSPPRDTAFADSLDANAVTSYAVKSGRLAIATHGQPKAAILPDGVYTNGSGTSIVIVDGTITRIQSGSGAITEISNVRLNRQRIVVLTPSTNALMAVADMTLPSGDFKSEDGRIAFRIAAGRPTTFSQSSEQ